MRRPHRTKNRRVMAAIAIAVRGDYGFAGLHKLLQDPEPDGCRGGLPDGRASCRIAGILIRC